MTKIGLLCVKYILWGLLGHQVGMALALRFLAANPKMVSVSSLIHAVHRCQGRRTVCQLLRPKTNPSHSFS